MLKRILAVYLFCLLSFLVQAQPPQGRRFDPARFQAEMEQFITTEAGLTPYEAEKFFPVYGELQRKQRALFDQMRRYHHVDPNDERACGEAIRMMDSCDLQRKKLQQSYHAKFLKILPASKVFKVIRAEEKFHRKIFKRIARH